MFVSSWWNEHQKHGWVFTQSICQSQNRVGAFDRTWTNLLTNTAIKPCAHTAAISNTVWKEPIRKHAKSGSRAWGAWLAYVCICIKSCFLQFLNYVQLCGFDQWFTRSVFCPSTQFMSITSDWLMVAYISSPPHLCEDFSVPTCGWICSWLDHTTLF